MSRVDSFKRNFKAWWEGLDVPPLSTEGGAARAPKVYKPRSVLWQRAPGETRNGGRLWNLTRAQLAEKMWGPHHHLPGGDEMILDLIKPFGLDSTQQLLDLHAGLGGAGRLVHKATGAWVRGFEPSKELMEIAQKRLKLDGLTRQITIDGYDPEQQVPQSPVDAVLLRDVLFTVHNKAGLFDALGEALKSEGFLAFTDYAARDHHVSAGLEAWLAAEPQRPELLTMGEVVGQLKARGFQVRIHEDITEHHRDTVVRGMQALLVYLQAHDLDPETRRSVMAEISIWRGRLQAFDNGLRMYRFFAIRK